MAAGASMLASAACAQPLVSPAWLRAHLSDPSVVVLDLRPAAQHDAGHVPGAVAADYEHSGWRVALPDGSGGALPPLSRIAGTIGHLGVGDASHAVLVSDDFGAAARIYWTFRVLGHQDVSILDGGWKAWAADPQDPVQKGPVAAHPASFTAHYDPTLRAELPEVEQAVATGGETLVDARPPGQWNGTAKASTVREYGHLPRAVWIDQTRALKPDGRLKPAAELQQIFAPAAAGKTITYCNTGHLAATDWFVLSEVLHRPNVKLYDASMSQWTADPSRPVVRPATEAKAQ
jgi:thiosulfate/3-mercaptopyruvate sulfurtransferase